MTNPAPVRSRTPREAPPARRPTPPVSVRITPGGPPFDGSLAATWRYDLPAGLVVFLVALPLCLGVSLASGAPLLSGLITGIVGGLVVSRLSGSPLMVSGPAAGLTAIVFAAITELGSFPAFLAAVVIAGVLQLTLGALKAGIIGYFFPSSVIRGMLAAIGIILISKQVPYALGAGAEVFEADSFTRPDGGNTVTSIGDALGGALPLALGITLLSILLLVVWPRVTSERLRRLAPAPLVVVLLAVGLNVLAGVALPGLALPREALVQLPVVRSAGDLAGFLTFPDWGAMGNPAVWRIGITLALVASLETLLSLEATDKLDPFKRSSPANRELLAQGAGNVLAGAAGGLPMTGVIVRSAANIGAGARTWRSSFLHGALLALAVVAGAALLNRIPLAVLAAVLIHTGFKLAHPAVVRQAWRVGPKYFIPFAVTVVAIVATDLLVGIGIGLAVGAFFVLCDHYRNAYSYDRRESPDGHDVRLTLADEVSFLNKAKINAALMKLAPGVRVTVDGSRTKHLDYDVVEMLHDYADTARSRGITLRLVGIPDPAGGLAH
jgi:MFS superfamily sulfate permease-like transporter